MNSSFINFVFCGTLRFARIATVVVALLSGANVAAQDLPGAPPAGCSSDSTGRDRPCAPGQAGTLPAPVAILAGALAYRARLDQDRVEHQTFLRLLEDRMDRALWERESEERAWQPPVIARDHRPRAWQSGESPSDRVLGTEFGGCAGPPSSPIHLTEPLAGRCVRLTSIARFAPRDAARELPQRLDYFSLRNGYIPRPGTAAACSPPSAGPLRFRLSRRPAPFSSFAISSITLRSLPGSLRPSRSLREPISISFQDVRHAIFPS